ncbi:uncharacterized protein LOC131188281 isoform X1 [Ahaetulla prasina]|uniref:uncharacterized protein LOC131188281 isoform X1 n=2 Tax=Ahaetulla prasina TaxID=499056 RepID=UPI0026474F27|nr:uncharacterized protein LOC131188281 isoform X1 [Ahaetulla prasina]
MTYHMTVKIWWILENSRRYSRGQGSQRDGAAQAATLRGMQQLTSEGIPHNEEVYVGKDKETEQLPSSYQKEEQEGNQEQQKSQYTNLLDFRWLQEKEEEEAAHQDDSSSMLEDLSSQGLFAKHTACDIQEGLWPPPGDNTEEHLETRVNEVSLIDSFESDGKLPTNTNLSKSSCLDSSSVDHEGYYLCDEEALLKESSASTGYYPCYRTYVEFPRYQPSNTSDLKEQKGSPCDASVQCDGCLEEEAVGREKKGVELNNNFKELKVSVALQDSSHGQPTGGSRPGSGGRKLEGPGGRRLRPSSSDQESGSARKEPEAILKPRTPGSSPYKASARLKTSKEPPASVPWNNLLLPTANISSRKSPQKRKHRSSQADEKEQATLMELKPLLQDQRSLPPSPEAKAGSPGILCYRTEQAGENSQVRPTKDKKSPSLRQLPPAVAFTTAAESPPSSAKPHTASSRLSFHTIVSWVWNIFKRPPSPQPQPSTSDETEIGGSRQSLTSRLRLWLTQRSGRIHPRPP